MTTRPPDTKRILCVGLAVMDMVFSIPEIPHREGKFFSHRFEQTGGGIAANAAATIVALGGSAALVTRLGIGRLGDQIRDDLAGLGVDVSHAEQVPGQSPISAVIVDQHGERLIVNNTEQSIFEPDFDTGGIDLRHFDGVFADTIWPQAAAPLLSAARDLGLPAVLDYDVFDRPEAYELLTCANHIAFSAPALQRLAGTQDLQKGLAHARTLTSAALSVSDGATGAFVHDDDHVDFVPAFKVKAVDTLAAGDVFQGALTLGLTEGMARSDAMRFAAASAAIKCTRFGGRKGIPSRDEVDAFLAHDGSELHGF